MSCPSNLFHSLFNSLCHSHYFGPNFINSDEEVRPVLEQELREPFTRPPAFPYPRCSTERNLCLPADLLFSRPPDTPLVPEEYIEKSGNGDGGNTSSG
ncbi:hypothetical protein TNCV_2886681 [Trichonephila clavipes]|nr:hypothetical protein TNCV_2886681 [Trichonephila clavipes]